MCHMIMSGNDCGNSVCFSCCRKVVNELADITSVRKSELGVGPVFLARPNPTHRAPAGGNATEISPRFWRQTTRLTCLPYGIVSVILHLAVLVQYRLVIDRRTDGQIQDDSIYCASIA